MSEWMNKLIEAIKEGKDLPYISKENKDLIDDEVIKEELGNFND